MTRDHVAKYFSKLNPWVAGGIVIALFVIFMSLLQTGLVHQMAGVKSPEEQRMEALHDINENITAMRNDLKHEVSRRRMDMRQVSAEFEELDERIDDNEEQIVKNKNASTRALFRANSIIENQRRRKR